MQEVFTKKVQGIEITFTRFFNQRGELLYITNYSPNASESFSLPVKMNEEGNWEILDKRYTPFIEPLNREIDQIIKENEAK